MDEKLELANEAQLFPPSPEGMADEALAVFVRDGLKKFSKLLPYVRELKNRFAALPRGHANIMDCRTWKEFCEKVLDRSPSAVRKALAEKAAPRAPKTLLLGIKSVLGFGEGARRSKSEIDVPALHFSVSEAGKLLVRTYSRSKKVAADYELDVEIIDPPGQVKFSSGGKELVLDVGVPRQPVDFWLGGAQNFISFLEHMEGDPLIVFHGPTKVLEMHESNDGKLRIINLSVEGVVTETVSPAPAQPSAPEPPPAEVYTGEFLPDLKVGDEVSVISHDHPNGLQVYPVLGVGANSIKTSLGTFSREGVFKNCEIWRIATDEDRQHAAEWKRQWKEALRAQQAKREEDQRQLEVLRAQVRDVVKRLPANVSVLDVSVLDNGISLRVGGLTFDQLERIVEALDADRKEDRK